MKKLHVAVVVLLLAGCSSGPSDSEIDAAIRMQFDEMNKMTSQMGMGESTKLHSAKSLGCKKATEGQGYVCDVELDVSMAMLGRRSGVSPIRFVKSDDGWRAVDEVR